MRVELRIVFALFLFATPSLAAELTHEAYTRLVDRYRDGDAKAVSDLAAAILDGQMPPGGPCRILKACDAALVLNFEAGAELLESGHTARADAILDWTRPRAVKRKLLAYEWLMALGKLKQSRADHTEAFRIYRWAHDVRPGDPEAVLGRATALEFSVLSDGFGGRWVAEVDLWQLVRGSSMVGPPAELLHIVSNPRGNSPYRSRVLAFLADSYRRVLEADPARAEAHLRLGRVLLEMGRKDEAQAELRLAAASGDSFVVPIARLCLARLETTPEAEAVAYRSTLEADPDIRPAWLGLGRALFAQGDRAGARAAVDHAFVKQVLADSTWLSYHKGLGRLYPEALKALRATRTETSKVP